MRCADDRRRETLPFANVAQFLDNCGVGDMPAIPGQQKIDSVNGSDGNVRRIGFGLCRNESPAVLATKLRLP